MVSSEVRINYKKLVNYFVKGDEFLTVCNYYTALPNDYDIDDKHRNFLKILKKEVRLRVRSVPLLKMHDIDGVVGSGYRYSKGEDILLAIEMVKDGILNHADHFVLVSGDADFVEPIKLLQYFGKVVTVVSFRSSLSHTLELEANAIIYLDDILGEIRL
jgi:uncharacterized LabA/DUF88 family protein